MTHDATWRFRPIDEDQKHVDPTHREHLATGGAVEPLVRESIQNSLDVTLEGRPTKVCFTIGSVKASDVRGYFETLWPHLEAITPSLPDGLPDPGQDVRFLAIEDYNTTGLTGDPANRREASPDGSKNHFFRFWHRVGPAREFKRRGSWGVGKVVFANASQVRTFFGITLRDGDQFPQLMGEAGLIIHRLQGNDVDYEWYGYFASHTMRKRDDGKEHPVILPVQDSSVVSGFAKAFGLARDTTGLSILVPHIRGEVKFNAIARAVVEQYFLPIVAGRLEVVVRGDGMPDLEIARSTIGDVVRQITWPATGSSSSAEVAKLIDLACWQVQLRDNEYVSLKTVGDAGTYAVTADMFPEGEFQRMKDAFAANDRIAFRIPVQVCPKQGAVAQEEVRLVLERDESLRSSNVPHLRSGINISKMRTKGPVGVRGILVIGADNEADQGELDKLLQASEGPAHINWEHQGEGYDKAKSLYNDAHKVIHFMRNLVHGFVEFLANPQDERDTRTLSSFFPDYSAEGNAGGGNPGRRRGGGPGEPAAPPPLPPGVIEVLVQSLVPALRGMRPVEGARVEVVGHSEKLTDDKGKCRFEDLASGSYEVVAQKAGIGDARASVVLPSENGVRVELILRRAPVPKMFTKVRLDDGFGIRGNPEFTGTLRPVRVRLAYAAWGGSKSYNPADFSLQDPQMAIKFQGILESSKDDLVVAPNVLRFTPTTSEFCLEVRGFDVNRGLHADARAVDEVDAERGEG